MSSREKDASGKGSPRGKIATTGTSTTGNTSLDTPSIDKYTEVKNQLTEQILKKQELTAKLTAIEDSIYEKETDYFNESTYGNIVKGFENFSKTSGGGGSNKRRYQYTDDDHIFSLSSVNYIKSLMKRQGISPNGINGSGYSSGPAASTNTRDDFDEYEDSVDPGSAAAAAAAAVNKPTATLGEESLSALATPTRKRKARNLDD